MKKIISFICVSVFASVSLFARDIVYKVSTYGDDANDGLTWATAKRTLGAAQSVAEYGDDIWVAAGIYYPTDGEYRYRWGGDSDDDVRYFTFQLKAGVRIYGGFPKLGNPDMNSRDVVNNKTIFSGNIGDSASGEDNSFRIFNNTDTTIDDLTVIDGLYIQDAYNDAMYNNGSSPLVRNCHFENNGSSITNENSASPIINDSVFKSTGAISGDNLTISKCEFSANSLAVNITENATISNSKFVSNTKGVYIKGNTVSISNCNFEKNTLYSIEIEDSSNLKVSNSSFIENHNTAIYGLRSGGTVDKCTFTGNRRKETCFYERGDIYFSSCIVMFGGLVEGSNFTENFATISLNRNYQKESMSGFFAAAIYSRGGIISNCTFTRNKLIVNETIESSIDSYLYSSGSVLKWGGTISGCSFIGNNCRVSNNNTLKAKTTGGLYLFNDVNATNCTFTKNCSSSPYGRVGGAVYLGLGSTITFSTITENYTKSSGASSVGDIYAELNSTVDSCIIWGNYSPRAKSVSDEISRTSTAKNCIIQDFEDSSDPKLLPLGNYGGITQTMPVDKGSSAIQSNREFSTSVQGLTGTYTCKGIRIVRIDSKIDYDWGKGSPMTGIGSDSWNAEWSGTITVPESTTYTFYLQCDDKGTLYIDGDRITSSSTGTTKNSKYLSKGEHSIKIDYTQDTGFDYIHLYWSYGNVSKTIIPSSCFTTNIPTNIPTTDQRGYTRSTTAPTIGACEYQTSVEQINIASSAGENVFAPNTKFTLKANTDADVLEWIWTKDGEPIESNPDGTLTDSLPSGSGKYTVTLVYDGGVMESEEFTVSTGPSAIYVKPTGNDEYDGLSWESPKKTIKAAIDASAYGSEIWIMNGTYEAISMRSGRNIIGGFSGTEKSKSQRILPDSLDNLSTLSTTVESISNGLEYERVIQDASIDGIKVLGDITALYSAFSIYNSYVAGNLKFTSDWIDTRQKIKNTKVCGTSDLWDISPFEILDSEFLGKLTFDNSYSSNGLNKEYFHKVSNISAGITNVSNPFVKFEKMNASTFDNSNSSDIEFTGAITGNLNNSSSNNAKYNLCYSESSGKLSISNTKNISVNNFITVEGTISASSDVEFINVAFKDSSDYAIDISDSNKVYFTNTVAYNAKSGGVNMSGSNRITFMNCTIYKNGGNGFKTDDSTDCAIFNTIIWGHTTPLNVANSVSDSWTVGYCNIQGGYANGTNIIAENPRILAVEDFDDIPIYLGLIESSPLQGKGATPEQVISSMSVPETDFRGITRKTPTSIGAFEYISPSALVNIGVKDGDVARGRDAVFSTNAKNVYRYYWVHSSTDEDWSWDIVSGENDSTYSRLTTSDDKFNENHYGSWLLDRNGGIKEAGYGNLNVFDLIFVKQGAMGKKDGSSWENAFTDVATAINAAMKKSRIYIAAGTYAVNDADTTNTDRKQAFALKNDLEIYGGFPAEGSPELADRDVSKYETILTADLLGDDEDADMDGAIDTDTMADNAYRVFFHPSSSALNETAVLDGVTIQGGYDDASEEEYKSGAGMHNNGSSPTIRNCTFVDNYSVNNGGGMYNVNAANPTIENCLFINNYAYYGGAVCDSGSSPSIKATEFSYNTAKYDGGAIRNNANSKPVIEDCDFANNSANRGAAIDAYESAPTAKRCSFSGNAATSSGGALYAYTSSNARLENCTLYNNSAYFGGGVYARENSNAQIVNCTISGNSAKYNGGALYSQNATPVIANSILWNNTAKTGNPEIYVKDSTPVINHCIVSGGYDGGVSVLTENPNLSSYGEYGGLTKSMPVDKTSSAWGAGILTLENIEIPLDDQSGSLRSTTAMTIGSMELHAAPTNLKATSGQYNDRVVLTWNASEDGKFYKVYRNTVNSPSGAIELTEDWITDLTYTDMAVEQGVNYYYFVRAAADVNGGSETWYSTSSVGYASKSTACNLTVVNGTGSGQYENGTQVAIVANAPQEGQTFDKWIGDTTYVSDVSAAETILTMPAADVTVTATYKAIEYYTLTVENGSGGGTVVSGDTVQIVADAPADGMVFDKWVGDVETVADVSASTTTIRMPAKNATVTATYIEKPVVDPFGDAVVYPNVAMTILGEVDFFGSPANSGCVVAAYVGNELRGKSSVVDISGRSLVNLTVNVNANGEEIKFKIWTPSDGKIIDARADCTAISASGDSLGSLDSPFAIVFANDLNLELLLKEGWNQVSFNVGLENMAVRTILSDVIDNVALVQGSGTSFNPSWPDSLNTLKSFNNTSGFWVKMNAASSVSLTGSALDVSAKTISLKAGWNNIGYTPATAASIRTVLATALADGKIERIINSKGNFNPATPDVLNSLKTMTPGEGYWVKANAATTIAYDKITTAKRAMRKSRAVIFAANSASENFGEPVVYPNIQMTILANVLVNGAAAPSGSVVAAFVDGELRAKQEIVSLDGKSIANLTVSVAQNGETIGFKIWNSATGETLDFATSVAAESGAAPYTYPDNLLELSASGTPSVGGDTEPAEPVVYPNTPMSLYVEVQIDGKTVSDGDIVAAYVGDELRGKQSVVIYDGKAIANLVVNVASNGEKIAFKVWNASAKRLYAAAKTIDAEIGGEPYTYPDNLLLVNAQTATGGLALWTSKNGLSGDNANALATPFNDGITNIEKFAFGLSGNKAASYAENALFKQSYADGKANFQFPISKDAADSVNVKVMTSEDLVNWTEAPSASIGTSGDFNLMQTEQTVPEGGKLFFKLVVEEK